ncbi:MAG: hypothetical protein KQH63_14315 [Desulfobulbaceae bacterium]|nr:hypothetical protein [Desulfobulbaceae bacterium]
MPDLLQYLEKKKEYSFFLSLLLLLVIDCLANPYAGIVHDARLYALQAMSHLHPGRYDKDLFFLFGSQDAFTVFSPFYVFFIKLFGLINGSLVLYVLSKAFFLVSLLFFFRQFTGRNSVIVFIAAVVLACNEIHYIFFDVNEPFLTPRLAAQALVLFVLGSIYTGRNMCGIILLFLAALFHPIMAFGGGVVTLVFWLLGRKWKVLSLSLLILSAFLILLFFLSPDLIKGLNPFLEFDEEWRNIVFNRSSYLFPFDWSQDEWLTVLASLIVAGASLSFLSAGQKRLVFSLAVTTVVCIIISLVVTYSYPLALPFQIQFWRAFWILRLINPLLCFLWGYALWDSGNFLKKIAALMVVIPCIMGGGISSAELFWVLAALMICLLPETVNKNISRRVQNIQTTLLAVVAFILLAIPLPVVLLHCTTYSVLFRLQTLIPWFVLVSGPYFPVLVLSVVLYLPNKVPQYVSAAFSGIFFIFLCLPGINPASYLPSHLEPQRTLLKDQLTDFPVDIWKKEIPAGSLIFTNTNALPVERIWFELGSSAYWSRLQGAGIIFNRSLALEYNRRLSLMKSAGYVDQIDSHSFGKDGSSRIDYIISRKRLPLPTKDEYKGIFLYATAR